MALRPWRERQRVVEYYGQSFAGSQVSRRPELPSLDGVVLHLQVQSLVVGSEQSRHRFRLRISLATMPASAPAEPAPGRVVGKTEVGYAATRSTRPVNSTLISGWGELV